MPERQVQSKVSLRRAKALAILLAAFGTTIVPGLAQEPGRWVKTEQACGVWNSDPSSDDVAHWSGKCVDGKVHGPGTLTWVRKSDGKLVARFVGVYSHGQRTGDGYLVDKRGNWFRGPFVNGAAHGKGSCYYAPLGIHRNCEFASGKLVGY